MKTFLILHCWLADYVFRVSLSDFGSHVVEFDVTEFRYPTPEWVQSAEFVLVRESNESYESASSIQLLTV